MWAWTDGAHPNIPARDLAALPAAHCTMNTDWATFTIASRSASRRDSYHFACSLSFPGMAVRYCQKVSTTGEKKQHNLRLPASLGQLNGQHLQIHAPTIRVLRIQYP